MIKLLLSIVVISIFCNNTNANEHVKILATGGTIAGKSHSSGGYAPGELSIDTLIAKIPDIKNHAEISWQQIANIGSQDMNIEVWKTLYVAIEKAKSNEEITGIVVTHGTDTLVHTAFLFDLLFPSGKPLIFVGAMRPADALSADGPQNLLDAIKVASSAEASNRGSLIVMNSKIIEARKAYKQHAETVETFRTTYGGYAGEMHNKNVTFYHMSGRGNNTKSIFNLSDIDNISEVPILGIYSGSSEKYYKDMLSKISKGLVISGFGNGNFPAFISNNLREIIVGGGAIVRSSQVPKGYVSRNVEVNDDQLGTIASLGLTPQKARILLGLLLDKNMSNSQIQKSFGCEVPTNNGSCGEIR